MFSRHRFIMYSLIAASGVVASNVAYAGAFALREQSAYYQGMSFAGNATTGPSISSVFWNPATITGAGDGLTIESHNSFIIPRSEMDGRFSGNGVTIPPSSIASGDVASDAWLPSFYSAYKFNDDLYFGLAVNTPFGLTTKPKYDWAGQYLSRSSEVMSVNVNPMVGYKINDMFSVALGLQVQYLQVRLKSASPFSLTRSSAEVKGDDVGFGVTAGLTFKPMDGTELGVGFRSAVSHELDGQYILPSGVLPGPTLFGAVDQSIKARLMTPEMVTLSLKQRISETFRVMGSVEWTNWSRLGTVHTRPQDGTSPTLAAIAAGTGGSPTPDLKFNYNDGWFFSIGGEYDFNEKLTLRAGVAYELSPIDTDIRSTRLPDNDRLWLSAGLTYNVMENMSFDLGYTHIIPDSTKIDISSGHQDYNPQIGSYTSDVDSSVDIVSASFRYRWGGPRQEPDYDPIRKY